MIRRDNHFATPVFSSKVADYQEINSPLLEKIYELRKNTPGKVKSNILGWQSKSVLMHTEEFQPLKNIIDLAVNTVIKELGYNIILKMNNAWANINPKYASNQVHDHPNSILSGAYFLQVPEPAAKITFHDPRHVKTFFEAELKNRANEYTAEAISYIPKEGMLMIFPGWLKHSVDVNMSEEERISLSFNYSE